MRLEGWLRSGQPRRYPPRWWVRQKIDQEIFGDAQIVLTLGAYSHVLPEAQAEAVEAMNGLLRGCAGRNLMKSESLRMRNWATPELIAPRRR